MSLREKRKARKHKKKKELIRKELSLHLFSVTAAEQNSPTHIKLRKNSGEHDINEYLEHRMKLRKKWIDKFFEFHSDIDSKIKEELREEAYDDMKTLRANLLEKLRSTI